MTRVRDKSKERRIRKEALKMIVKEGFDGLSMQKLARAAGVSPATIYIYFEDRDDLIRQIGKEEERAMFTATLEGFDPEMDFETGLRTQWNNRARYFLRNPARMHFMEQLKYTRFHETGDYPEKDIFIQSMTQFAKKAIKNGELKRLSLEVYWAVAFAPLYQLVKFHINKKGMHGHDFELNEPTLELALSAVIKGLKP